MAQPFIRHKFSKLSSTTLGFMESCVLSNTSFLIIHPVASRLYSMLSLCEYITKPNKFHRLIYFPIVSHAHVTMTNSNCSGKLVIITNPQNWKRHETHRSVNSNIKAHTKINVISTSILIYGG